MKESGKERRVKGKEFSITYSLFRKKVKHINMRIHRDGRITVSAPHYVPATYIDEFVLSKEGVIIKNQQKLEERKKRETDESPLLYGEDIFEEICKKMYFLLEPYKISYPQIQVRKMKSRWGTCYVQKQKIILNRALLKAPIKAIEYVVLHELVHFIHGNHSSDFYEVIREVMPDWKERKELLKQVMI